MISYEITRKRPYTPLPVVQYGVPYHQRMGLFERRQLEKRQKQADAIFNLDAANDKPVRMPFTDELVTELRGKEDYRPNPPTIVPMGMGKVQYAQWLNEHVYPKFPKGTFITFKTIPIVLNAVPKVFFIVREIQEMHHWVNVDKETREPRAVGLSLPGNHVPVYYPPAVLRPLVESEIAAIDKLRNQASEGRNREATANDTGTPVVIDRSTGEILVEEE